MPSDQSGTTLPRIGQCARCGDEIEYGQCYVMGPDTKRRHSFCKTIGGICGCDGYFDEGCPACTPAEVPFPGTRTEREAWWRNTFVVGQPHPFDLTMKGEPLTQAWVDEAVTALLDSEDAANAR